MKVGYLRGGWYHKKSIHEDHMYDALPIVVFKKYPGKNLGNAWEMFNIYIIQNKTCNWITVKYFFRIVTRKLAK